MIKVSLSNEILNRISAIDENRFSINEAKLPQATANRLRKNSKKKSRSQCSILHTSAFII